MKTFFYWIFKSIYQGGIIMVLAMVLFEDSFINIVGITFTALILAELLNVCFEVPAVSDDILTGGGDGWKYTIVVSVSGIGSLVVCLCGALRWGLCFGDCAAHSLTLVFT